MPSWFRAGLLVALGALLPGCGDDGEGPGAAEGNLAQEEAERGGTAILAELSDINKPLPLVTESSLDGDLGSDVLFLSLTRGSWEDGRLRYLTADESPMALARRYEYAGPDSSALRYHMRSDMRWSDGRPITAQDVVWTYETLARPEVASPFHGYTEHLDSVVAENDSTVVFHFDRRYPEMLFHSGLGIAPKHVFEGTDPAQIRTHPALLNPARGNLVVSGPFKIGEWAKGERVTLVQNEHFPVKPNLDQIVIRVVPEPTTRLVELQTGRVDFTRPIPHEQIPHLRAQAPNVRFEKEEKRFYDYIGYNPRTFEPFADREIRTALGMGIDVQAIIRALQMEEFAVPAGGPYSPLFQELYDPRTMAPLPYDTARARQILEQKGWVDRDGDGIREKNGRPFRFTLLTNAGNARRADASQIIQQQWKRIGVDARLQTLETNTFFDRLREKNFEAALGGWQVALSPDLSTLWNKDSPFNFVSYDNPRTFALFDSAQAQPTEEQAAPYWKAAAAQIVADRPYTWLFYFDQVDGVRDRLRGMKINTYGAYQNTWQWWIPEAQQGAQPGQAAPPAQGDTVR